MKVAVTGAGGDFGTAILRALIAEEDVREIVAIDLVDPRLEERKIRPVRLDVRSPALAEHLAGAETVIHLAFVLVPGRDLDAARSVNIDGTMNALEASAAAGARRFVVASSMSAHGVPSKGQAPVDEETPPRREPDHFYFDDKARVELLLDEWEASHPASGPVITRLRPGFVYGPDFSNPALALMGAPLAIVPDDGGRTQLVHQSDLARAFVTAALADHPGGYLIVTDDWITHEDLARASGGRVIRIPKRIARTALDAAYAARLSPVSGEWAVSGDRVGVLGAARERLGWEPELNSRESALVLLAQAGRELRYVDGPPRKAVAERMLEVPTSLVLEARERNPALADLDLERTLAASEHEWIGLRGRLVHLEVLPAGDEAPTAVIVPGLGDHARRHAALAAALHDAGYNVIGIDRLGHGLSEGRRGDASLEDDFAVTELAIAHARGRSRGPVVVIGDSLGGIMSWYLLTREPDVDAVVCHCIGHPDEDPDPGFRRKARVTKALARIAPSARLSVRLIADYDEVALDPVTKAYFDDEVDGLFNFSVTARAAAAYIGFRPRRAWEEVATPVLVVIGLADRMVTPEFTRAALARGAPPRAELLEIPGAGHQLFLDDLGLSREPVLGWLDRHL